MTVLAQTHHTTRIWPGFHPQSISQSQRRKPPMTWSLQKTNCIGKIHDGVLRDGVCERACVNYLLAPVVFASVENTGRRKTDVIVTFNCWSQTFHHVTAEIERRPKVTVTLFVWQQPNVGNELSIFRGSVWLKTRLPPVATNWGRNLLIQMEYCGIVEAVMFLKVCIREEFPEGEESLMLGATLLFSNLFEQPYTKLPIEKNPNLNKQTKNNT